MTVPATYARAVNVTRACFAGLYPAFLPWRHRMSFCFFFCALRVGACQLRKEAQCFVCPIHYSNICFYTLVDCVVLARARLTNFPHPYFHPSKQKKRACSNCPKRRTRSALRPGSRQSFTPTCLPQVMASRTTAALLQAGGWVACQQTFPNSLGLLIAGNECRKAAAMPQRRAKMLAVSLPEHSSTRKR